MLVLNRWKKVCMLAAVYKKIYVCLLLLIKKIVFYKTVQEYTNLRNSPVQASN